MKFAASVLTCVVSVFALLVAQDNKTYVGLITDTMCGASHAAMKVSPDSKCVKDCVRDGKTFQYALLDGKKLYKLSDQDTPSKFAARR